jgi:threonine dehydrogenase-like Zn-dependent dehydrogenase
MRAARIVAPGRVELEHIAIPDPGPGQVRIRIEACGVCGSNIPVWEGREWFKYPLHPGNPGHEGYGRIDALGAGVTGLEVGQPIAAPSYNAFAEYDVAAAVNVVPIPDDYDGCIILGEPLGCAINVARRCGFEPGQTVAIIGIGFLGALLVQLAAEQVGPDGKLIAISRRPDSLEIARLCGADETIPLTTRDQTRAAVEHLLDGKLCDVVIEATGFQEPLDLAAELTRERGRLVIAGYHQDGNRTVNMQLWNWRGIDVINAHERDPRTFTEGMRLAVEAVSSGRLRPEPLLTHRYPLEQLDRALEAARTRPEGFIKAIVTTGYGDRS